jgi:hypothetical protein
VTYNTSPAQRAKLARTAFPSSPCVTQWTQTCASTRLNKEVNEGPWSRRGWYFPDSHSRRQTLRIVPTNPTKVGGAPKDQWGEGSFGKTLSTSSRDGEDASEDAHAVSS